ncbi:ankyrin repeat protein [Lumpy skin disease virus]|uniref:Ankyrin repeat protein n=1 Tax=Lumpy skin disease virus TaxID=59509 RepID=A0A6G8IYM2_LSDV|nr:ankyrin repeat protein [Lumpy skin disease virus]UJD73448.1 ankyrin repeat protein [Lumpy skin disease virus]
MILLYDYITLTKSRNIKVKNIIKLIKNDQLIDFNYKLFTLCEYVSKKHIRIDVLKILFEIGCKENLHRLSYYTLLSFFKNYKIKYNFNHVKSIIELITSYGVSFNDEPIKKDSYPILFLVSNEKFNHISLYEYLENNNINFNIVRSDGYNLLHLYLESCNNIKLSVLKLLIKNNVNVNGLTRFRNLTPLHIYLCKGYCLNYSVINFLIDTGSEINCGKETLLYSFFTTCDNEKVFKSLTTKLIKKGADINQKSESGLTPLMGFVAYSDLATPNNIKFILSCGGNQLVVHPQSNETLLHIYLRRYDVSLSTISTLLESGININSVNFKNYTPLHVYVDKNIEHLSLDVVDYLIYKGATTERVNRYDCFAKTILEVFLEKNKFLNNSSRYFINYILKYFPINEKDLYGFTPLLSSVYVNNVNFFNYFLRLGSSINVISEICETCVSIPIENQYKRFLKIVLDSKPNIKTIKATLRYLSDKEFNTRTKFKLMKHCIKYLFTLDPDEYKNHRFISSKFKSVVNECQKDIITMKSTFLKTVSVYDLIFNKNGTMHKRYLNTMEVRKYLKSNIYAERVRCVINNSIEKDKKIDSIIKKVNILCKHTIWDILPEEIKDNIFNCMSLRDIRVIFHMFVVYKP